MGPPPAGHATLAVHFPLRVPSRFRPLSSNVRQPRVTSVFRNHCSAAMGREGTASSHARCPPASVNSRCPHAPARLQSVRSTRNHRRGRELNHRARTRTQECNGASKMFLPKCKAFCLTGRSSGPPPAGRAMLAGHLPLRAASRWRPLS
jgi:hypothetical protein